MLPIVNELGKVCILGSEVSGGSILKAGYTIEDVLKMESEAEQRQLLETIEHNRRLERAKEDNGESGGRNAGVTINAGRVHIGGNVYGNDSKQ